MALPAPHLDDRTFQSLELKAGTGVKIDGGTQAEVKAAAGLTLDGGAMVQVKGASVQLG